MGGLHDQSASALSSVPGAKLVRWCQTRVLVNQPKTRLFLGGWRPGVRVPEQTVSRTNIPQSGITDFFRAAHALLDFTYTRAEDCRRFSE